MATKSEGLNLETTTGKAPTVSTQEVFFNSNGLKIAAVLYLPDTANKPTPAIVVGHPGSGVKEQTAAIYARMLAERGFITLTFDAAHQGESDGIPRGLEDPRQRVEDFKCAVSFLHTVDLVDTENIGLFGICAGGGYSLAAAAADHRVKAVATVIAADIARQFKKGGDGKQEPAVFQTLLDIAAKDRTAEANGNAPGVFPLFPNTEEEAKASGEHGYEGWQYYCTPRGQHPRSAKFLTWNSVDRVALFDAFAFMDQISPRPVLMISGSEAVTRWMSEEAIAAAKHPKELFVINGANHMALYDHAVYVKQAVEKAAGFFTSAFDLA